MLVIIEHDRGVLPEAAREAMTVARAMRDDIGNRLEVAVVGAGADALIDTLTEMGADTLHLVRHLLLTDYGPEAWGESLAQLVDDLEPDLVMSVGSERGNEIVAQVAARLDVGFAANCLSFTLGDPHTLTRLQWGGSLLEDSTFEAAVPLLTFALHAVAAEPAAAPGEGVVEEFEPDLDDSLARTIVCDRVVLTQGVTLPTAPVVVGGGRGVGSAPAFAPLEELAQLLGGVVGCSRAVTNNGWRPHADQVGQTGTRIAPELYIASGISGAIQHWVGAMASKQILAINTDAEANMVIRADYAVIADLHVMIPAISEEILHRRRRRS